MTLRLAIVACVVCCASARAEQFPYTALVNAPDAYLRSGPGEQYYAVNKLDRGQRVEVYRHDPGGWCAVRPLADCFSWVSGEFVEPRLDNFGVVTGDRVVVRVGSSFSDTRDVIQVRLNRGEEVEIIDAQELDSGPSTQTWFKILPPAGEFRWVSARCIVREFGEPKHRDPAAGDKPIAREQGEDEKEDDEVRRVHHEEPASKSTTRGWSRPQQPSSEADASSEDIAEEDTSASRLHPDHRQPKAVLKEEAEDLDLALSAMVIAEPEEWDFTLLRRQAEAALSRAETALDRGRIRRVLRKIDNFADIQRRHLAAMTSPSGVRASRSPLVADRPPLSSRSAGLSPLRYDGVGRLTQIASVDPRVPQFALVDSSGQVAAYVSPAPGVNLRRYLNQEVGINGTLGYLPERQATHLTAKRVVSVEGGLR